MTWPPQTDTSPDTTAPGQAPYDPSACRTIQLAWTDHALIIVDAEPGLAVDDVIAGLHAEDLGALEARLAGISDTGRIRRSLEEAMPWMLPAADGQAPPAPRGTVGPARSSPDHRPELTRRITDAAGSRRRRPCRAAGGHDEGSDVADGSTTSARTRQPRSRTWAWLRTPAASGSPSTSHQPFEGRSWPDTVREVEALGYSTLFVPDHFDEGLGPIAAMAAAAAVTTTLNVGPLVLDCDFRHPVPLARELATIDQLSEGRLEVGLGAGWKTLDYERSGIPMDRPGVRVDRLIEHTAVLKALFADGPFTFAGEHYRSPTSTARPSRSPPGGPPILVGGGAPAAAALGRRRPPTSSASTPRSTPARSTPTRRRTAWPSASTRRSAWVREGAGDRFDDLELNAWLAVAEVTDDSAGFAETHRRRSSAPTAAELLESPLVLVGSATRGRRAARASAASAGATRTTSSPATRPTTSPPSWPTSPAVSHEPRRCGQPRADRTPHHPPFRPRPQNAA